MNALTLALILVAILLAPGLVAATQADASIVTENGFTATVNLTAEKQDDMVHADVIVTTGNVKGYIAISYDEDWPAGDFLTPNARLYTDADLPTNAGLLHVDVIGTDSGGKKGYIYWLIDPATLGIQKMVPAD